MVLLSSSRSHRQQIVDRMRKVMRINTERTSGSVGLKVGLVACRLADLYVHPSPGYKEWDLCVPHAIMEAAGGRMTDCWGNPLRYNKRDVRGHNGLVASNGILTTKLWRRRPRLRQSLDSMKMTASGKSD